ncbi:MAG: hypothetical protein A3G41_08750 [Elusimicrobia bacterium RIFCSPLOWO2_12_FULL_59_9]|nr:MAG: hypothetical protein A3G41_08750 [Elusimicrobia bacterium RIFCSPLOWO2_12_FULL_59_9]
MNRLSFRGAKSTQLLGLAAFFIIAAVALPWGGLADRFYRGQIEERALDAWVYKFRQHPLRYLDVYFSNPPNRYVGFPVVWEIDHPSTDVSYAEGIPSKKIIWSNESQVPTTSHSKRSIRAVARVRWVYEGAVLLEYLGRR